MLPVKVCGLTRLEDAALAWELGAAALGFIFHLRSPRAITPEDAARIRRRLPREAFVVGVFVDERPSQINRVAASVGLQAVQLHGSESPETCRTLALPVIKALRAEDLGDAEPLDKYGAAALLLDASHPTLRGGSGLQADWGAARRLAPRCRLILAGGLGPENALQAAAQVRPAALDVNSGVESSPGRKDPALLRALFRLLPPKGERPCLLV